METLIFPDPRALSAIEKLVSHNSGSGTATRLVLRGGYSWDSKDLSQLSHPLIFLQITALIKKYILRQQTIMLVVVPSNVDIATTEALSMAQEVDPEGDRTIGKKRDKPTNGRWSGSGKASLESKWVFVGTCAGVGAAPSR